LLFFFSYFFLFPLSSFVCGSKITPSFFLILTFVFFNGPSPKWCSVECDVGYNDFSQQCGYHFFLLFLFHFFLSFVFLCFPEPVMIQTTGEYPDLYYGTLRSVDAMGKILLLFI
jgi:hypothetical protein